MGPNSVQLDQFPGMVQCVGIGQHVTAGAVCPVQQNLQRQRIALADSGAVDKGTIKRINFPVIGKYTFLLFVLINPYQLSFRPND